jgi:hypothetical protein
MKGNRITLRAYKKALLYRKLFNFIYKRSWSNTDKKHLNKNPKIIRDG